MIYKFITGVIQYFCLGKGALKICCKLTENTHAEVQFQLICKATLLKSHFSMGVLQ